MDFVGPQKPSVSERKSQFHPLTVWRGRRRWDAWADRGLLTVFSVGVLLYSFAVLVLVAYMGDIGIRCVFGTEVKEEVPPGYVWQGGRPRAGDAILAIGERQIASYS